MQVSCKLSSHASWMRRKRRGWLMGGV
jgi:hypothetical protein